MRKLIGLLLVCGLLLAGLASKSYGATATDPASLSKVKSETEMEYLSPMWDNRQLDTVSLNLFFHYRDDPARHLSYFRGATITRAWGYVNEAEKELADDAVGIGPVWMVRYQPWQWGKAALAVDMSGGIIFYNQNFPTDGDFYNFMWRLGPEFSYAINDNYRLSIGCKIMHVSNGQHGHNPSYNGDGFSIGIIKTF